MGAAQRTSGYVISSGPVRHLPKYEADAMVVPFVVGATAEYVDEEVVWAEHSHPTHELLWNEGGASTVTVGDVTWTITDTWGLWVPAGTLHSAVTRKNTTCRSAHFNIHAAPRLAPGCTGVEITPLLGQLLDRLCEDGLEPRSRELTERLVVDVIRPAEQELAITVPRTPLVAPVVDTILANPGDRSSLRQWANRLQVSTRTISRIFHAETGHTFSRWQASVQAQHAVMLLTSGVPIDEVARATGYATVSGFGAAFRRSTGTTPGSFRP